jgi:SAM-dependent methyltransferase
MPQILVDIAIAAMTVAAVLVLLSQCRKPKGWLGRLVARNMNARHSRLTDWGLAHVQLGRDFTALDIGCGGGRTVAKLADACVGAVHGIDYSAASVAAAQKTNSRFIEAGRVEIRKASVSHLPFPDGTFDIATAVETHYYWPDLDRDLREILRVLKPTGTLVIIAETYRGRRFDILYRPVMMLLRATYLSVPAHRDRLAAAGYSDVEVFEERRKGWICAMGRRPSIRDAAASTRAELPASEPGTSP